ncbi:MAG: preprotein translocase subunit YajC, partial [Holosporales bacterium]|nr:preprotein translocase subunit YajC [Holosporales bacterium]
MSFLPMLAFIAILYFLLIRPQQKRQKQHKELISALKKGDKVVTSSGIIATVSKITGDHEIVLEIAHNVHCKFVRSAITSVAQSETAAVAASADSSMSGVIEGKGRSV